MEDKRTVFAAILTALIVSISVPLTGNVLEHELENHYTCDITDEIGVFLGGISGTSYSGYPFADSRKGAVYCGNSDNKGKWIPVLEQAKALDIDPYDLVLDEKESYEQPAGTGALREICPPGKACYQVPM